MSVDQLIVPMAVIAGFFAVLGLFGTWRRVLVVTGLVYIAMIVIMQHSVFINDLMLPTLYRLPSRVAAGPVSVTVYFGLALALFVVLYILYVLLWRPQSQIRAEGCAGNLVKGVVTGVAGWALCVTALIASLGLLRFSAIGGMPINAIADPFARSIIEFTVPVAVNITTVWIPNGLPTILQPIITPVF